MKAGKTSFAAQFEKNLILATEKGYNALADIFVVDIGSWRDFKTVLRQLKAPEAMEKYNTITVDTIGLLWALVEKYICAKEGVAELGEIPYGRGYAMASKEFSESLREIAMLGYGMVFIAHSEEKAVSFGSDETIIRPSLPRRAYEIVNQIVDLIAYIGVEFDENGESFRTLYTRSTPNLYAGSRFKHLPAKIPFGYNELVEALAFAIEETGRQGGTLTNEKREQFIATTESQYTFNEVMEQAKNQWVLATKADKTEQAAAIIEKVFGRKMKLSEATPEQQPFVEEVVELMAKLNE